jgi:hypothetical protein
MITFPLLSLIHGQDKIVYIDTQWPHYIYPLFITVHYPIVKKPNIVLQCTTGNAIEHQLGL